MRASFRIAALLLSSCAIAACSASSSIGEERTGNGEDEVRTSECPETFTLELDKPEIYSRTPSKHYDGSPLAERERVGVERAMREARRFRKQTLSFRVTQKANAQCSYVSTLSSAANAPKAVLRGTTAKPTIDVTFGAFRYYAFPKTYATTGFTFERNAKAGVFSQVAASDQVSDGASPIVKIGSAKIGGTSSPPPAGGGSIADAVGELESAALLPGPGHHDDYAVSGSTPLEMVKSYIAAKYADDTELGEEYTYKENASGLASDEQVAGTLTKEVALSEAMSSVQNWYSAEDSQTPHMVKVKAALDRLVAAGAKFGFDGFEQNGCAAPTSFLLVIDTNAKHVYGVDLNPCEE